MYIYRYHWKFQRFKTNTSNKRKTNSLKVRSDAKIGDLIFKKHNKFMFFFLKSCFLVPNSNLGKTYQGWHWICFLPTHGPSRLCVSASRFCLVAYRQSWFIIVQIDLNLRHWTLGNQDGDFGFFIGFNKLLFLKHMLKPIGSMYFFSLHLP